MSDKTRIFITGATGYLGSCVLDRLLTHTDASNFDITALVRSANQAEKLRTLGIKTVLGSYLDADLGFLTHAGRESDVVITVASTSGALQASAALLQGFKQRYEQTGKPGVLIHTSGAGLVADKTSPGQHAPHQTYSDLDVEALNSRPDDAKHRDVDKMLIAADTEGYVKSYFVTLVRYVFGQPSGRVVDLGITNRFSIDVPFMIIPAMKRKRGGFIETGESVWTAVEVHEAADLFIVILDAVLDDTKANLAGHGREGYYFAASFIYEHRAIANAIAASLVDLGYAEEREANPFSDEEIKTMFGVRTVRS
ncbi:hypothetical protein BJ165DRAFT_1533776 [Panaeolus papilionaceus]|nr:hypothetical protein BJ165DRAFT_1533776 [Panaeolus papilionaceus]